MAGKIHALVCTRLVPWYIYAFARHCDQVLVPSKGIGKMLADQAGAVPVEVLPTGVPESFFDCPEEEKREIRERWAPGGRHLFCTVSRLAREKNIGFLLRAAAAYKDRNGDTFRLLIIGDGPQREQLQGEAASLGLAAQVSFIGEVPNQRLNVYNHAADLFLFSSKTETQGIVLLEAMSGGTPVVAVEASGVRDVVTDGVNGRLVGESPLEFSAALENYSRDSLAYGRCAREALATARRYSVSGIAARAAGIYQQAVAGRRKEEAHDLQTVHLVSEASGSNLPH